jgi:hypothetical protein
MRSSITFAEVNEADRIEMLNISYVWQIKKKPTHHDCHTLHGCICTKSWVLTSVEQVVCGGLVPARTNFASRACSTESDMQSGRRLFHLAQAQARVAAVAGEGRRWSMRAAV